ncbi:MAG: 30S ribosomal protein S27ae [Candidatus Aenigmatarchaeota archaeon]
MGERKVKRKGKKTRKGRKHEASKIYKIYKIEAGKIKRERRTCPRCGAGVFLAEHKGRLYCGRCAYTEIEKG